MPLLAAAVCFALASVPSKRQWTRGDLPEYFIPVNDWLGQELSSGRLPFWNPMIGCGLDQFSTFQSGACYPLQWLNAILPANITLYLLAVVHLAIASMGTFFG